MSSLDKEFLLERFLRSLGSSASSHTQRMYRSIAGAFLDFLDSEQISLDQASTKTIEDFFFDMDKPLSSASERAYLSVLSSFFDHLIVQGETASNPATRYRQAARKRFRTNRDPKLNVLTPEMFEKILDAVSSIGAHRKWTEAEIQRNKTLLHVLFGSGLRRAELHALNCNAYDAKSGSLMVRGKGGKVRRVALLVETEEVLRGYLADVRPAFSPPPDEPAFCNASAARCAG